MVNPSVIDLPSVGQANQASNQLPIEVTVRANGPLQLRDLETGNSADIELNALAQRVQTLQSEPSNGPTPNKPRPVVIAAEKTIEYQYVINTMDRLQRAGIVNVGLLVKPKGEQGA
jgi:biopolymer transport protein TolR